MRSALLIAALLLTTGCGSDSADDPAASGETASGETTGGETSTAPEASGDAACLVGTWALDAESISFDDVPGMSEIPNASFSLGETRGEATLTFSASGETIQRFDGFVLTVDASVGGMNMSVANRFEGTAEAGYSVDGDRIVFTPGDASLTSSVTVGGQTQPNPLPVESLFENAERGEPTFRCDGDVLSLDIRTPEADGGEVMFADARYTRVAG